MASIAVRDANGILVYMEVVGSGTELDPYRNRSETFVQDQTTDTISLFLGNVQSLVTILNSIAKDDENVNIETDGYIPIAGDFLCMQEDGKITQEEIITVTPIAGNQYTVKIAVPSDYPYTILGGCTVMKVDMSINGAITPVNFAVAPKGDYRWDVTRMMISMTLTSSGDDGKFGNLTKLTNGVFFRKEDSANSQNLFNAKDNSDFALEGFDLVYPLRSGGGGDFGMRSRITFGGQDKRGVVVRMDGSTGDSFRATVRDDLTLISSFRVKIQGHIVD